MRLLDLLRVSLRTPALGLPGLVIPLGRLEQLRSRIQIVAGRFREGLCLDAGEVYRSGRGVVTPIDPRS
jgi:amidase